MRKVDLTGQRFGRLLVTESLPSRALASGRAKTLYRARCACGSVVEVLGDNLRSGHTQSCGCFHDDAARTNNLRHGATRGYRLSPQYRVWSQMIQRCTNPKNEKWERYGGRGIRVCDRWRYGENGQTGYACFLADMGERPSAELSIDREKNGGDYEPGNCRWATSAEQRRNQG